VQHRLARARLRPHTGRQCAGIERQFPRDIRRHYRIRHRRASVELESAQELAAGFAVGDLDLYGAASGAISHSP
jgi:hypothetical protein